MYGERQIWPAPPGNLYTPTNPVGLYVFRSDLLGISNIGKTAGLFHTGLGFSENSTGTLWVIDLAALTSLEAAVLPTVDAGGRAVVDSRTCIEYYSPETRAKWDSYWNRAYRSTVICEISPTVYKDLIQYILGPLTRQIGVYSLLTLQSVPELHWNRSLVVREAREYTVDITCDSLVLQSFRFLKQSHNTAISSLPFLQVTGACVAPPTPVSATDPELLAFVKKLDLTVQSLRTKFQAPQQAALHTAKRDRTLPVAAYQQLFDSPVLNTPVFVYSRDSETGAAAFYRVTLSALTPSSSQVNLLDDHPQPALGFSGCDDNSHIQGIMLLLGVIALLVLVRNL